MKKWLFLIPVLHTAAAFCQQAVVANNQLNIVYCGLQNPLSVLVAGYPCQLVHLTTSNGTIRKTGCGKFIYEPKATGLVNLKVWIQQGHSTRLAYTVLYRVTAFPYTIAAAIGTYRNGRISQSYLQQMGGMIAKLINSAVYVNLQVLDYTVTATRNDTLLFREHNTGAKYTDPLINCFHQLHPGDQLLFSVIRCVDPTGKAVVINPLEFIITDDAL